MWDGASPPSSTKVCSPAQSFGFITQNHYSNPWPLAIVNHQPLSAPGGWGRGGGLGVPSLGASGDQARPRSCPEAPATSHFISTENTPPLPRFPGSVCHGPGTKTKYLFFYCTASRLHLPIQEHVTPRVTGRAHGPPHPEFRSAGAAWDTEGPAPGRARCFHSTDKKSSRPEG